MDITHAIPANKDASMVVAPMPKVDNFTSMTKCPYCGYNCYEHGWCFGCGKPIQKGEGIRIKAHS